MHMFDQWYFSNSPIRRPKGVAIAIHEKCPFMFKIDLQIMKLDMLFGDFVWAANNPRLNICSKFRTSNFYR